jgi:hypothetical protein
MIPDPPNFTQEDLDWCREHNNYSPMLFEWYKFVGGLCVTFSNILQISESVRNDISKRDYGILIGLLNRCARLILANIALSHEGKFGESTSILDRCIFESSIILSWLCRTDKEDRFDRYVASGLRTELELKDQVNKAITERNDTHLKIEDRMLDSIERCIVDSGFDDERILKTKQLPDIAAMLTVLGHKRFSYTAGQRIGSHHVHGTWVGLIFNFIEKDDTGNYHVQTSTPTRVDQYIYISQLVLDALSDFVSFIFLDEEQIEHTTKLFEDTKKEMGELGVEVVGTDFDENNF